MTTTVTTPRCLRIGTGGHRKPQETGQRDLLSPPESFCVSMGLQLCHPRFYCCFNWFRHWFIREVDKGNIKKREHQGVCSGFFLFHFLWIARKGTIEAMPIVERKVTIEAMPIVDRTQSHYKGNVHCGTQSL